MKALIVEDNKEKLENAVRILKKHSITEYVHINNQKEVCGLLRNEQEISKFDIILLDLCFYVRNPQKCKVGPDSKAGATFLVEMADCDRNIPVIIYSSETDWEENLQKMLLGSDYPTFTVHSDVSYLSSSIRAAFEKSKKRFDFIQSIVKGHAHNEYELDELMQKVI